MQDLTQFQIWNETRELLLRFMTASGAATYSQAVTWLAADAVAALERNELDLQPVRVDDRSGRQTRIATDALKMLDRLMVHPRQPRSRQQVLHWLVSAALANYPALGERRTEPAKKRPEAAVGR